MPELSRFFGIIITMYHNDHPPPHFHVRYGERRGRFTINDLRMMDGDIGTRVRGLVVEWAGLHQRELAENWTRAQAQEPLAPIPPLE